MNDPNVLNDEEQLALFKASYMIFYRADGKEQVLIRHDIDAERMVEAMFSTLWTRVWSGHVPKSEMARAVKRHMGALLSVLGISDDRDEMIEAQKTRIESLEYALSKLGMTEDADAGQANR